MASLIAERLSRCVPLSAAENSFLDSLAAPSVRLRRHQTIQHAGKRVQGAFALKAGWAISYSRYRDGSRQIRRVHLPGDLLAMPSLAMQHHAEDIEALTDVVVAPFERRTFAQLFTQHPRLAAIMFMFAQEERVTSGDRMGCIGRLDCHARIAFLVMDVLNRLRAVDPSIASTFEMRLKREDMAEMTGMTAAHASRMWSDLMARGWIRGEGSMVTVVDEGALLNLSGYTARSHDLDFGWLPDGETSRAARFEWKIGA